jgi:hypothetical protein
MAAYAAHDALERAVLRRAHPRRIEQLRLRAERAWRNGARLHRWRDAAWCRVARWHLAAVRHGVVLPGAPVPERLPLGIDEPWPQVPLGVQWLYRAGLPHYGCGPALLIDGTWWHPRNGSYLAVYNQVAG